MASTISSAVKPFPRRWVTRLPPPGAKPSIHFLGTSPPSPRPDRYSRACALPFPLPRISCRWKNSADSRQTSFRRWRFVRVRPSHSDSAISMWARSASLRTASGNDRSSSFITRSNALPPSSHPKQCQSCVDGSILNEGVFSWCSGQQAQKSRPFRFTWVRSATSATRSVASRTFCTSSWLIRPLAKRFLLFVIM